jgi:hypothetical protein
MSEQLTFFLLRSADARKVGQRATGKIQYELLCDTNHKAVFIRIVGNEGGGYFSREKIDFASALQCVAGYEGDRTLPSKVFQAAFVGRSSNNAGFLAAVLRAEGLLDAAPGTDFQHIVSGDWLAWKNATLALEGTLLPEAAPATVGIDTSASSEERSATLPEHIEQAKDGKSRKRQMPAKRR